MLRSGQSRSTIFEASLLFCGLPKSSTGSAPVLVDELDARRSRDMNRSRPTILFPVICIFPGTRNPLYVDVIIRSYEAATGAPVIVADSGETFEQGSGPQT